MPAEDAVKLILIINHSFTQQKLYAKPQTGLNLKGCVTHTQFPSDKPKPFNLHFTHKFHFQRNPPPIEMHWQSKTVRPQID